MIDILTPTLKKIAVGLVLTGLAAIACMLAVLLWITFASGLWVHYGFATMIWASLALALVGIIVLVATW